MIPRATLSSRALVIFVAGLIMLVVPDIVGYYRWHHGLPDLLWLDILGTFLDASVFTTVFLLLNQDIQRRRRAEAEIVQTNHELRETNAQLAGASQLKTQLLGLAAHDLKNPLGSITQLARLLSASASDSKEVREAAEHIEMAADEMLNLVNDLLDSAAIESGQLRIEPTLLDLREALEGVARSLRPAADAKAQRIACEPGEPIAVEADSKRIRQIIENLASNAIKFSPRNKTITLSAKAIDGHAELVVADEGPGLAPADMDRLFQRFQQLTARPTGGEGSTGLGLWIVRHLARLHGGNVRAESPGQGKGTRFIVELPLENH